MKTIAVTRLTANFKHLCFNYKMLTEYAITNVPKEYDMKEYIKNYTKIWQKSPAIIKIPYYIPIYLEIPPQVFRWIISVHKLQPKNFHLTQSLNQDDFMTEHFKQIEFSKKIQSVLEKFDLTKFTEDYHHYLETCIKNPSKIIIPNLRQDFMWHSHMQDHATYVADTVSIFGHILDHRTDTEEQANSNRLQRKSQQNTKTKYNKNTIPYSSCSGTIYYSHYYSNPMILPISYNASDVGHTLSSCSSSSCSSCGGGDD